MSVISTTIYDEKALSDAEEIVCRYTAKGSDRPKHLKPSDIAHCYNTLSAILKMMEEKRGGKL